MVIMSRQSRQSRQSEVARRRSKGGGVKEV